MEGKPPLFGEWRVALSPPWIHSESVYPISLGNRALRCETHQRIGRRSKNKNFELGKRASPKGEVQEHEPPGLK